MQNYKHMKFINSNDITADMRQKMFEMYVQSYTMGGQQLWFTESNQMFERYTTVIKFAEHDLDTVFGMGRISDANMCKLSLVCHNCTESAKKLAIELRINCIELGWILEASDKVGWILRKNNVPIIPNNQVHLVLGCTKSEIKINENFDLNDKCSYQYVRTFVDGDTTYYTKDILFGNVIYINALYQQLHL